MHLMIFYPGGVSYGALPDDASDQELYDTLYSAATLEQGNGKGVRRRRDEKSKRDDTSKSR